MASSYEKSTTTSKTSPKPRLNPNPAMNRRDAINERVRKDLRVEGEARSYCNEVSARKTRNNQRPGRRESPQGSRQRNRVICPDSFTDAGGPDIAQFPPRRFNGPDNSLSSLGSLRERVTAGPFGELFANLRDEREQSRDDKEQLMDCIDELQTDLNENQFVRRPSANSRLARTASIRLQR